MSIISIFKKVIGSPAAKPLIAWGKTEAELAVAALKNSPQGAQIAALISAAEETGKSGPQKLADVLLAAAPIVLELVQKGGGQAEVGAVQGLTRAVVESFVADLKSGSLAVAVLAALGVK